MTQTINIDNPADIRIKGTAALIEALGPIGAVKYIEQFDNGGTGDYTKEKYESEDLTIEDILALKK